MSQAVVLNVALDDYDMSQATIASSTDTSSASLYAMFMNRMNVVKTGDGTAAGEGWAAAGVDTVKFGKSASSNYTLFFNDGITFTFPKTAKTCTEGNATVTASLCKGVIDVNGAKNPNKLVNCDGKAWNAGGDSCTVTNPTDMYPIVMYDQSILPATAAGQAVLYCGK